MTLDFLAKYPFIYQKFLERLGYYSRGIYAFEHKKLIPSDADNKLMFIVAKSHYGETWQSFSSIKKSELNKLINLKKKASGQQQAIFQILENKAIDGYGVKTITFDVDVIKVLGGSKILIPETELLHTQTNQVIEVNTPRGLLFSSMVGNKVNSAYAQGIIANLNTYKLSAGLPNDALVKKINQDNFPTFIIERLTKTPINQLLSKSLTDPRSWFNLNQLHWLYGAPLLTALAFYIVTNSYLAIQTHLVEPSLADGGEQISAVLSQKQEIDNKSQRLAQLSQEFSQQSLIHHHWQIVSKLLDEGATITRITYKEGELTVRGSAEKASSVLASIAEFEAVKSASFNGPVRSSRGVDAFVLQIIPKEQA